MSGKETKQGSFYLKYKWADRRIWTDRMLAALVIGVKGNKWFSMIDKVYRPETLKSAWKDVRRNRGAGGIDGQSIKKLAASEEKYLNELHESLKNGSYRAMSVKRVEIPKGNGKTRPLGIPTVKDRIVQSAIKRVIEPIWEREFMEMSYGFRPGRDSKDALREVDGLIKSGYSYVVDADLKSFFDSIDHSRMLERVKEQIGDGRLVKWKN